MGLEGFEVIKVDELQRAEMAGFENHGGSATGILGFDPTLDAEAPALPWNQTRKGELWSGSGQVVPVFTGECEECLSHDRANRVKSVIMGASPAESVSEKTGQRVGATDLQRASKHVGRSRHHWIT